MNDYYLPYEALSYAWGDQSDLVEIVCNGTSLKVTRNLHDALLAIRFQDEPRTVWVDALCINQNDIRERNHQVQLMADIYSGATRVIVWLGIADADTDSTLDIIRQCSKAFDTKAKEPDQPGINSNHTDLSYGIPPLDDARWKMLGNFLLRPWFKRAWVVQEVALANEVIFYCGTKTISWEQVLKAMLIIFCMDLGDLVANGNESIICLHFYQKAYAINRSCLGVKNTVLQLEVLLLAEGARLASDDRDKVFSLLGLASDVQASNNPFGMSIQADYGKEAADVYVELTQAVIGHYKSLSILAAAGLPIESGRHRIPSWVCDRSLKPRANVFMSPTAKQRFSACTSQARYRFTPGQQDLVVSGIVVDTISILGDPYSHRDLEETIILQWGNIAGMGEPLVTQRDINSFRLTLIGNFGQDGPVTDFELDSFFPWYQNITSRRLDMAPRGDGCSIGPNIDEDSMIRRFSALVHRASGWRSFFVTKNGLMGIGPATAAVGDLVCVVEGATVPLILRKWDGEGQDIRYKFVGESYVHGLMDGEGYKPDLVGELTLC